MLETPFFIQVAVPSIPVGILEANLEGYLQFV